MNESVHILFVDQEDVIPNLLAQPLIESGHSVERTATAAEALHKIRKTHYAAVIINTETDGKASLRLIQDIRLRSSNTQSVAIIQRTQINTAKHALEAGAYDCVILPMDNIPFIIAIIERAVEKYRLLQENRSLSERVKQHAEGLSTVTRKLHKLATIDEITGLHNQKHFHEAMAMEISRSQRYRREFSLIMSDIVDFAAYQTHHGNKASELLLYSLANLLRDHIRTSDTLTRYNDHEFALLLPETGNSGASALIKRMRESIDRHPFPGRECFPEGRIVIRAGIATFPGQGTTGGALIERSYLALDIGQETTN